MSMYNWSLAHANESIIPNFATNSSTLATFPPPTRFGGSATLSVSNWVLYLLRDLQGWVFRWVSFKMLGSEAYHGSVFDNYTSEKWDLMKLIWKSLPLSLIHENKTQQYCTTWKIYLTSNPLLPLTANDISAPHHHHQSLWPLPLHLSPHPHPTCSQSRLTPT
jgi:hypothetical protein